MKINFLSDQISAISKNFIKRIVSNWNINKPNKSVKISYLGYEEFRDALESLLLQNNLPDVLR